MGPHPRSVRLVGQGLLTYSLRRISFDIPQESDGVQVGRFLRSHGGLSARLITRLKRVPDGITLNGEHIRTVDTVRAGDTLAVCIPDDARPAQPVALPVSLGFVFEDDDLAVIEKPANLPMHPTRGHALDTLANAYACHLAGRGEQGAFRPINRLDRDTTGLVVVCRHSHSANRLHGHMQKRYFAVCEGVLEGSGTIDAPIRRAEGDGIRREVGEGGQRSVTHWEALCSAEGMTLLRIRLETGRTHQIRTHFADFMHMPLAGDPMYGGSTALLSRQALHCGQVEFDHPVRGEHMVFRSPLPPDIAALPPCRVFLGAGGDLFAETPSEQ